MKDRRVKNISGMGQIILDIKPDRCDSDVYINQKIDVTNLVKYIEKSKEGDNKLTYFHAFMMAIGMTIYNRPKLNYYVRNRHLYEHSDIVIAFVAKTSFNDKSEEMMIQIRFEENDNIFSIKDKINKELNKYRNNYSHDNKKGANSAIDILAKLPNIIRIPIVGLLKWTDKVGLLPKSLCKDNLYYSSLIVSNLGSIKCGAIYHNITNFGTCSGLLTMGEIKKEEIINNKGKKELRDFVEFGVNLDERIGDGYYFIKSLKLLEYILNNPKMLEKNCFTKINMEEIR